MFCMRLTHTGSGHRMYVLETVWGAAWDLYSQQDIEKLERVQRQAARFIMKDYRTREPCCVNRMLSTPTGRTSETGTLRTYVQDNWRFHPRHAPLLPPLSEAPLHPPPKKTPPNNNNKNYLTKLPDPC